MLPLKIVILIISISILSSCSSNHSDLSVVHHDKNKLKVKDSSTEIDIWADFDKKETLFIKDAVLYHSIESLPEDFISFYNKFISDTEYQKVHIKFPILAAVSECDTTIILNKSNWEIFNWDFRKDFYNPLDSNIIYLSKNKFYFKNIREEIGELFRMGFEKIEGEWYMTYYLADAC